MPVRPGPNRRRLLDFVHDQTTDARRFQILAVVDAPFGCELALLAANQATKIEFIRLEG